MGRTYHTPGWRWFIHENSSQWARRKSPQRETQTALGRCSGGRCSKARILKLESSRPKPGRMEETPKWGRGPPWAVAPLERERECVFASASFLVCLDAHYMSWTTFEYFIFMILQTAHLLNRHLKAYHVACVSLYRAFHNVLRDYKHL
jgi:hypothetical protein